MNKKKIIGLKVKHIVELNHPIEVDLDDLDNINIDLSNTTDEVFHNIAQIVYDLGHNHKYGVADFIYEDEEL